MFMNNKYGTYSNEQLYSVKKSIQKSIFFLLLCVDPVTKDRYKSVNLEKAFIDLQNKIGGLNQLFGEPPELVFVMSFIEEAFQLVKAREAENNFHRYRKLILDAGAEIMRMGSDEK